MLDGPPGPPSLPPLCVLGLDDFILASLRFLDQTRVDRNSLKVDKRVLVLRRESKKIVGALDRLGNSLLYSAGVSGSSRHRHMDCRWESRLSLFGSSDDVGGYRYRWNRRGARPAV